MNQVDSDFPIGAEMSRLALFCWGLFVGGITAMPPHSLTWGFVIQNAGITLATYWIFRGLGRINRYRKQQRAW